MTPSVFEYAGLVSLVSAALGAAVGIEEVSGGFRVDLQLRRGVGDGGGQPRADVEAVVGQRHGRGEEVAPRGLAVLLVDVHQHPQDARHADGAAGRPGVGLGLGAVGVGDPAQVVLGGRGGSDLPAVVGLHGVGLGVVVEQEPAAADPGRLRLDQPQHRLCGDQRVGRGAAVLAAPRRPSAWPAGWPWRPHSARCARRSCPCGSRWRPRGWWRCCARSWANRRARPREVFGAGVPFSTIAHGPAAAGGAFPRRRIRPAPGRPPPAGPSPFAMTGSASLDGRSSGSADDRQ